MSFVPEIYCIHAEPRTKAAALPECPNPPVRPQGSGRPLVLKFHSSVPRGVDVAEGRAAKRDTNYYLQAIRDASDRSISMLIDCAGGEAGSAAAIALALLHHPWRVTARITGRCSSAAIFLALAADFRTIVPGGTVLIHRSARLCTPEQFEAMRQLSEAAKAAINESLTATDDLTAAVLTSRLGITELRARDWMTQGRNWTATEALEFGFVHAIEDHAEVAS
ncbi:ATP-dependent Clp protease proteolytic subunit [Bradyrhizobium sp. B097]|uniref:ATP-dependent Clp protease proteolytic subunit n=1 Tax=Bradyrhizobium sp. B097 TaxID=3140244 RepID=UPI003182C50A